jgi:beta-glucosidase
MVFQSGKPVVFVLVNGGQVAIDNLVEPSSAIIEAFNPNDIGGKALALSLFGLENRWGKLPYTLYPHSTMQAFDMKDHSMTNPPGRTYRYYTGDVIYPFGFGLSLSQFAMDCHVQHGAQLSFACVVENLSDMSGEEVIQVYHSAGSAIRTQVDHPVPLKSLIDFERVHVDAHKNTAISFAYDFDVLKIRNAQGDRILYAGRHSILFTNGVLTPIEFQLFIGDSLQATIVSE